jgi:CheY-like chemotaxis protein
MMRTDSGIGRLQGAPPPLTGELNARVLVVDDLQTNLAVARGMLKNYGLTVDCVTGGQEAIDAISSESVCYDAIFMDHMMPEMDGVEATRLIREIDTDYARNIPIIAFTANKVAGNEEMFLRSGFQAFILKPLETENLDPIIQKWVLSEKTEAHQPPVLSPQHPLLRFQVDGIDLARGLGRFSGDGDAYIDVLRSYASNTAPLLEAAAAVTRELLAVYAVVVHGIKGSSRGICADEVADMAEALEVAANAEEYDYIEANNAAFIEAALALISGVNEMLTKIHAEKPREKKEKPDSAILEKLRAASSSFDMDAVDTAITELDAFEYETGGELIAWLRENADQMEYGKITQRLSDL